MTEPAKFMGESLSAPDLPADPMTRRRVLGLAVQDIGEDLLQAPLGIVDTRMVASRGASALAGVGIANETVFFMELNWPVFRRTLAHREAEIAAEDRGSN